MTSPVPIVPSGWSVPDVRGWATLGMFALVAYDLTLIAMQPSLADNELFKTATILLLGTGGFGLVCAFLWGGSKASNAAADTVNTIAASGSTPPPGTVTTTHVTTSAATSPTEPVAVVVANAADHPVPVTTDPEPPHFMDRPVS